MSDTDELKEKISAAKEAVNPKKKEPDQGLQAGYELVGSIFLFAAIGYGLDRWLDTKPAFMMGLFFVGVIVGFYNVYRTVNNMGGTVGLKNTKDSALKDDQKTANHNKQM